MSVEVKRFGGHGGVVWGLSMCPNGKQFVSGSGDRTLRLWDIATGETVRQFQGHTKYVRCVSMCPNGKQFVSGSRDNTLRL